MTYTLRRTGLSDRQDDFQFLWNSHAVGRTYLQDTPVGPRWYWSIYGTAILRYPKDVVAQGSADSLDEAKEAFKLNWEKLRAADAVRPKIMEVKDAERR
jgi:hypothetical protein